MKYQWPGNVRELKSAFEYAFVACQGETIEPLHLPMNILEIRPALSSPVSEGTSLNDIKKQRLIKALDAAGGNRSEAARILGISRTSVWNQVKRFGLSH